jgi:hypothetical protein
MKRTYSIVVLILVATSLFATGGQRPADRPSAVGMFSSAPAAAPFLTPPCADQNDPRNHTKRDRYEYFSSCEFVDRFIFQPERNQLTAKPRWRQAIEVSTHDGISS